MTAIINGITVTGTPDEINELIGKQSVVDITPKIAPYNPDITTPITPYYPGNAWWGIYPPTPCVPRDAYGNPIPYCSAKNSADTTTSAVLNTTGETK